MKQKVEERLKAIELRKQGYSANEIVKKVGVAKGSISVWIRNVPLTGKGRKRLLTRIKLCQLRSAEKRRARTK
jgi:transposase